MGMFILLSTVETKAQCHLISLEAIFIVEQIYDNNVISKQNFLCSYGNYA